MPNLVKIKGSEKSLADPQTLGGKAYQQALAASDELPVPDGIVLTTEAFPGGAWLKEGAQKTPQQQAEAVRKHLEELGIDLIEIVSQFSSKTFAFRSSATAEDLNVASFAGSFTTKLNVKPNEAFSAVYEIWGSTFSPRVRQYLTDLRLADKWDKLKMGILIQPMIDPILSGVGLSHSLGKQDDPFIVLTVVRGLGEPLVRGEVEPQTYFIERGTWAIVKQQNASDAHVIYEIADEIGRAIEFLEIKRGAPQDIEFAIDREYKFLLLQNRPIVMGHPRGVL
jgi:pyruvate,water dikinase